MISITMIVIVKVRKNQDIIDIKIKPYSTQVAQQWAAQLQTFQEQNIKILEKDRIYSLNNEWTEEVIFGKIEDCWNKISEEWSSLGKFPKGEKNQDLMNQLHQRFEEMVGLDKKRTNILKSVSQSVASSINQFNVLIHRYEAYMRYQSKQKNSRIVVTFDKKNKQAIRDEDFKKFTQHYQPGEVILNYCHVGKPVLDYLFDDDNHASPDNILPQNKWCADFVISFSGGPGMRAGFAERRDLLWDNNKKILNKRGLYIDDPKLALGGLPVGKLVDDCQIVKERIFGISEVVSVSVK